MNIFPKIHFINWCMGEKYLTFTKIKHFIKNLCKTFSENRLKKFKNPKLVKLVKIFYHSRR
jgi:hypothetical protein